MTRRRALPLAVFSSLPFVLRSLLPSHASMLKPSCLVVFFLLAASPPATNVASDAPRPNIVFVFADDWGRIASAYAKTDGPGKLHDVMQTPNFDRVARQGVLFRNAFVNSPSCTPCRSALLSGQHFWRTGRGAVLHGAVWDSQIPVFPLLLRDAGFSIGKSFKVWGPGRPVDAPFDGQRHAYERAGRRFNEFSENATRLVQTGQTAEAAKQQLLGEVRANFAAFLDDRPPDQPFLYWFGATTAHRKWVAGSGQKFWGIDPQSLEGKLPPFLPDVPELREDMADYLGEIQAFDAGLGQLIAELEAGNLLDSTVIVVSGDHGPPGFPHGKCNLYDFGTAVPLAICGPKIPGGRVVDDLVTLPDLAPTLLEFAALAPPPEMTGRSLAPLLHSDRQGQVDAERTWVLAGRERHVADAREGNLPYPQRSIRTRDHLYIINFAPERWPLGEPRGLDQPGSPSWEALSQVTYTTLSDVDAGPAKAWLVQHRHDPRWKPYFDRAFGRRPREELYVLADDPHQMHNVASDAHCETVRQQLHDQLMAELIRTGDPRVTGDGQQYEREPFVGPPPKEQR